MKKNILKYILPPTFTLIILLGIFFVKNIFPFGSGNISSCDMSQLFVPMYTHLYDALHGTKSLLFDWYSAGGNNMAGLVSFIGLLNPINLLFFLFVPRKNILEYMSIYFILKMALSSFTMSFYLTKRYIKLETFWHVIFSLIYVFSGYVLQYYTNINWLDFTILFPLLILSLDRLLKTGKYGYYILTYSLCLVTNIYLSFMVTIFIILYAGLYTLIVMPKKSRKKHILIFAIGSVISLLLSAFITLPAILQMVFSIRSIASLSFFREAINLPSAFNKIFILLCLELPFILMFKLSKKQNKTSTFLLASTFLVLMPIFIERINLIWHTGSYVIFPTRFGFIISFMLISCGAYYLTHFYKKEEMKNNIIYTLICISLLVLLAILSFVNYTNINWQAITMGIFDTKLEILYFLTFIFIVAFLYWYILKIKHNTLKKALIISTIAFEIIFISFGFIGSKTDNLIKEIYSEHDSIYIKDILTIKNELDIPYNNLSRIKFKDLIFSSNYPYISETCSFSNWTNMISEPTFYLNQKLGYPYNYTRLLDYGGTIFSDALLNYNYTISKSKLPEELYEEIDSSENFYLYKNKISMPFGITINKNLENLECKNPLQYQNEIYKTLFNENLIDITQFTETLNVNEKSILYAYYLPSQTTDITYKVNGKEISSIKNKNVTNYQKAYGGIIELGIFNNQTIYLEIDSKENINKKDILLGIMPISKLNKISKIDYNHAQNIKTENSSLTMNITSEKPNEILFLPISYDLGWNAYINGEKVQIISLLDNSLIGIKLKNGFNNITMDFFPSGMKLGIVISILGIIILTIYHFIKNKLEFLGKIVLYIFYGILLLVFLVVYIFPILYNIFVLIR